LEITAAIFTSDSRLRDGMRFTVGALIHQLFDGRSGTPLTLGHESGRPIGWSLPLCVTITPKVSLLCGLSGIPSSPEEAELLYQRTREYDIAFQIAQLEPHLPRLQAALGPALSSAAKYAHIDGTCAIRPGIAATLFPSIFEPTDKSGLVPLEPLLRDRIRPGIYRVGELAIFAHHFFRRGLSRRNNLNWDLLAGIEEESVSGTKRIRLDPDMVALADSITDPLEHEYWYGPPFSDDLATIPVGVARFKNDDDSAAMTGVASMDFFWSSRKKKHTFEAEELRNEADSGLGDDEFGCRYVHSIVDEEDGTIEHLDGAIRLYDLSSMTERLDHSLDSAPRRSSYTKLWRVDGVIALASWKRLVYNHFRGHDMVREYFGGQVEQMTADFMEPEPEFKPKRRAVDLTILVRLLDAEFVREHVTSKATRLKAKDVVLPDVSPDIAPHTGPDLSLGPIIDLHDTDFEQSLRELVELTPPSSHIRLRFITVVRLPNADFALTFEGTPTALCASYAWLNALYAAQNLDTFALRMTDLVEFIRGERG